MFVNETWSGWWFGTCFIFSSIGNSNPNWLSYFSEGLKPRKISKVLYALKDEILILIRFVEWWSEWTDCYVGGVGREHRLLWQGLWRLLGSDSPSVREGSQILNLLMNEYSQPVVIDYNRFFPVKKLLCLLGVLWPIHYRISKPQPRSLAEWQSSGVCEDINRGRFSRQLAVVKKMLTSKDVLVRALVTPLLFGARLEVPRDTSISSSFAAPAEWPKPAKRFCRTGVLFIAGCGPPCAVWSRQDVPAVAYFPRKGQTRQESRLSHDH